MFGVYFLGWDRGGAAPTSGATIGFPDDKPKQIAIENDAISDCALGGCPGDFGAGFWRVEAYDVSVTEVGSSGGALLDQNDRVVGVLAGGVGSHCNDFEWDEFAKLDTSWTNLQPFLDPDATGALTLDGTDGPVSVPALAIGGRLLVIGALLLGVGLMGFQRESAVSRRCRNSSAS